jgi:hypothetical protein
LSTVLVSDPLSKPPRLLDSKTGYDWREFDRWMQRLWLLLGSGALSQAYNVINSSTDHAIEISGISAEIYTASHGLDQASHATDALAAIYMLSNNAASTATSDLQDIQSIVHTTSKYNEPSGDEGCLHWM